MKAFNRLSAGLCLSVFLFCPVHGVWGQGAGESSWHPKGLVDTYHAFRSEKPNDWMSSRTRLRGEVGKNFAGSSLFVSFNATYNALLKERTGFELREAYLDHRQEHWGFRLGRQLVIWGAADGVRITDLVSPMDMTEFLAQDYDDIRMPVNALRFFVFNDKIKLELPFPLSKDTSCPPMPPIRGACCLKKHPGPLSGTRREAAPSYASPT